jgi:hypothetical protein
VVGQRREGFGPPFFGLLRRIVFVVIDVAVISADDRRRKKECYAERSSRTRRIRNGGMRQNAALMGLATSKLVGYISSVRPSKT